MEFCLSRWDVRGYASRGLIGIDSFRAKTQAKEVRNGVQKQSITEGRKEISAKIQAKKVKR